MQNGWMKPLALREDKVARLLAAALPGEAEAIALALELSAELVLLVDVALPSGLGCG